MKNLIFALSLGISVGTLTAQNPGGSADGQRRPKPPILTALDLNSDGTIDADEIAKAPASLKTLDKNGDGKLTSDEFRPKHSGGQGKQGGLGGGGDVGAPPQHSRGGQNSPGGENGGHRVPPIIAALDLNSDGTIDADEIAKASESLKKLDKNGDGKLTSDEIRPNQGGRGGQGQQGGPGGRGGQGGQGGQKGGKPPGSGQNQHP